MIVRTGEFAREKNPLIGTNVTNTGKGDSVIAVSPAVARERIRAGMRQALEGDLSAHPLPSAAEYELRLRFEHHGDAYKCAARATVPRIAVSALSCRCLVMQVPVLSSGQAGRLADGCRRERHLHGHRERLSVLLTLLATGSW